MKPIIQPKRTRVVAPKKARLPPPTRLLFGHGVIPGKVVDGKVVVESRIGLVITTAPGTVEAHAVKNGVLKAHFEAAKAMRKWPSNAEVPEADFLAAVQTAITVKLQ